MNSDQLTLLRTCDLLSLRDRINSVLKRRRKAERRKRRLKNIVDLEPITFTKDGAFQENSSNLYEPPNHYRRMHNSNMECLPALIGQDWSHLYNGMDGHEIYYVYAHVDPRKSSFVSYDSCGGNYGGRPFYIGKGSGNRAFDLKRNQGHGKLIKEIIGQGYEKDNIVQILLDGLSEAKAFEVEAKLIYYFGTIYAGSTKKKGLLLNLDIPPVPDFTGVMVKYSKPKDSAKDIGAAE